MVNTLCLLRRWSVEAVANLVSLVAEAGAGDMAAGEVGEAVMAEATVVDEIEVTVAVEAVEVTAAVAEIVGVLAADVAAKGAETEEMVEFHVDVKL